jgi:hypothetical protein
LREQLVTRENEPMNDLTNLGDEDEKVGREIETDVVFSLVYSSFLGGWFISTSIPRNSSIPNPYVSCHCVSSFLSSRNWHRIIGSN